GRRRRARRLAPPRRRRLLPGAAAHRRPGVAAPPLRDLRPLRPRDDPRPRRGNRHRPPLGPSALRRVRRARRLRPQQARSRPNPRRRLARPLPSRAYHLRHDHEHRTPDQPPQRDRARDGSRGDRGNRRRRPRRPPSRPDPGARPAADCRRPGGGRAAGAGAGGLMRRVFAAVLALWSTLAIVAVLAWSHHPAATTAALQGTPATVVVRGPNGTSQLGGVLVPTSATQPVATTRASTVGGGTATAATATGGVLVPTSATQPVATTRAS